MSLTFKDLPDSHDDFKKLQTPLASPLPIPKFPTMKLDLDWGMFRLVFKAAG